MPEKIRVIADEIFYMGEKVATLEPSAILSFRLDFIELVECGGVQEQDEDWNDES